mgnify:CR=1 FL=1
MNVRHPLYRRMVGRQTVLAAIHEHTPQPVDGEALRAELREVWDETMGAVVTHLDLLVSSGMVDRTITEDRRDLYATVDWLDDKIAEEGLMACALDTVPRIDAATIESGRWVLMLGCEVIAHASSLRALREGSKPWPEGAIAWRVESTYRLEPNESIEVSP